uniref:Prostaglandin E2 receptor EP3 subtype n=1 Tax=Ursus maritimus TaxID=29073 RepID=A0A452TKU6_URSMA
CDARYSYEVQLATTCTAMGKVNFQISQIFIKMRIIFDVTGKHQLCFLCCMNHEKVFNPVVIVVYLSKQRWEHLDPSGRLCTFFGLTMTVFGLSSLFIASAMAVERALAIRAPHWYASHMKTRATRVVLLGVWLAVLAFALLPVLGVGQYTIQWPGTWCFISTGGGGNGTSPSHNWGNLFFASTFAFLGLSALAVPFACNLATIKALVSRCRAKATVSQSGAQWGRITTETAIQLMGIMCVLSVCWSPLLIMMLKMIFNQTSVEHCKTHTEKLKECNFFLIAVRLASLNQILDPWVYLLLRKILLRKFCQVANAVSIAINLTVNLGISGMPLFMH